MTKLTTFKTNQGRLEGEPNSTRDPLAFIPRAAAALMTSCGRLSPRYDVDLPRYPEVPPVTIHSNRGLRSIVLEKAQKVATPLGPLPAEKLIFYSDGRLRRLFPLAGKTNAYWTEKQEGEVCPLIELATPIGKLSARFVSILFYPSGALRSFALWPGTELTLDTPLGPLPCRFGASFYSDGKLKSVEPSRPITACTPIGPITAFDSASIGIHGEGGSLQFAPDGTVSAVHTESTVVDFIAPGQERIEYAPRLIPSMCSDDAYDWQALSIKFQTDRVSLGGFEQALIPEFFKTREKTANAQKHLSVI